MRGVSSFVGGSLTSVAGTTSMGAGARPLSQTQLNLVNNLLADTSEATAEREMPTRTLEGKEAIDWLFGGGAQSSEESEAEVDAATVSKVPLLLLGLQRLGCEQPRGLAAAVLHTLLCASEPHAALQAAAPLRSWLVATEAPLGEPLCAEMLRVALGAFALPSFSTPALDPHHPDPQAAVRAEKVVGSHLPMVALPALKSRLLGDIVAHAVRASLPRGTRSREQGAGSSSCADKESLQTQSAAHAELVGLALAVLDGPQCAAEASEASRSGASRAAAQALTFLHATGCAAAKEALEIAVYDWGEKSIPPKGVPDGGRGYQLLLDELRRLSAADGPCGAMLKLRRALVTRSLRHSARFVAPAVLGASSASSEPPVPPAVVETLPLLCLQPVDESKLQTVKTDAGMSATWRLLLMLLSHLLQMAVADGGAGDLAKSDTFHKAHRALKRRHRRWVKALARHDVDDVSDFGFFACAELLHNRRVSTGKEQQEEAVAATQAEPMTIVLE